ncbi:MAG: hypothetical protein C3F02_01195 [Parcubacteria group bacterium]|nr:MAG: hypothetical protein C3F02_01195 [Parcubacteria group bacterium]
MSTKQALQFAAVVVQNLPEMSGEIMQRHIDDPKGLQTLLRKVFLTFPILMTVKLGTGLKTADNFRQAIKKAKMDIGSWASDLLNQDAFRVAGQPTEVSIIAPTVAELGFKDGARYADICQRGVEMGYELCPSELGPQLRLQYQNQPKGEVLWLAMEAIRRSGGLLSTFFVGHGDGGLWLRGGGAVPGGFFRAGDRIVFVCRK